MFLIIASPVILSNLMSAAACLGGDVLLAVRRQALGSVLLVYNWVESGRCRSFVGGSDHLETTDRKSVVRERV